MKKIKQNKKTEIKKRNRKKKTAYQQVKKYVSLYSLSNIYYQLGPPKQVFPL